MKPKIYFSNPYKKNSGGGYIATKHLISGLRNIGFNVVMINSLFQYLKSFFNLIKHRGKGSIIISQGLFNPNFLIVNSLSWFFNFKVINIPRGTYIPLGNERWKVKHFIIKKTLFNLFIDKFLSNSLVICSSEIEIKRLKKVSKFNYKYKIIPDVIDMKIRFPNKKINGKIDFPFNNNFFLYVGRISEEKNLKFLVDCISKLNYEINERLKLILLTNNVNHKNYHELKNYILDNKLSGQIFILNEDQISLDILYANCICNLLPSHIESFGITPLEAIYFGKKSIVSKNTSWSSKKMSFIIDVDLDIEMWTKNMLDLYYDSKKNSHYVNDDIFKKFDNSLILEKWNKVLCHKPNI